MLKGKKLAKYNEMLARQKPREVKKPAPVVKEEVPEVLEDEVPEDDGQEALDEELRWNMMEESGYHA